MKTITQILSLTLALILGFSQLGLSNNKSQKTAEQGMLGDSTKLISKRLPTSVYHIESGAKKQESVFDQMLNASGEVLEIKLTTDLQNIILNKKKDEYQVAYIEMKGANGNNISHNLKVKPRGKYRRSICDFPPLKLNFAKDELVKQSLHPEFDKLKLVTHCSTGNKMEAKDNVLREYLTYQMYNKLTDNSFRVQLVKIEYVDLHNSSKPVTRYGFLIEDKDEMAMRINGEICNCHGLTPDMITKTPYNLMSMFQYMIGNEDWSAKMVRNVKAVQLFTGGMGNNILVPYDFDFSGVVNAPYAIPDIKLKHQTVKQRHFYGEFSDANDLKVMSNHFLSRKKEILKTVRSFKRLSADSRIEIEVYLKEFFLVLENEEQATDIFLNNETVSLNEH